MNRKKKAKKQSGQVIVITAVMLTVLIASGGMMIDLGYVYVMRAKLKNTADSAALAAVYNLPNSGTATTTANSYITKNLSGTTSTVTTPYNGSNNEISVYLQRRVPHYFMQIMGFTSTNVVAKSVGAAYVSTPPNVFGSPNLLPIGVPDTAPSTCVIWGPNNQCNDYNPSLGGGPLNSQYKGLLDYATCNEFADPSVTNCATFVAATPNDPSKSQDINAWILNGCLCHIGTGNDIAVVNGDLGQNVASPMSTRCTQQNLSDSGGSYGLFVMPIYDKIFPSSGNIPPSIDVISFAQYKVYCGNISSSSASGTFQMLVTNSGTATTVAPNNYTGFVTVGLLE